MTLGLEKSTVAIASYMATKVKAQTLHWLSDCFNIFSMKFHVYLPAQAVVIQIVTNAPTVDVHTIKTRWLWINRS